MTVSPERKAQLLADLEEIVGRHKPPPPKPKVVARDGETIRDANVHVSQSDPNAANAVDGVVSVRRADFVTINFAAYEEQQAVRERERQENRRCDPYRLGLYGEIDDNE